MKIIQILICAIFCFFLSCESKNNSTENTTPKSHEDKKINHKGEQYPSITLDIMRKIFEESDYADFVFYNTNFSMSMDQKPSIQGTIRHISESVPAIDPACKAIGRVFYQIDGENFMEADIFFENDCKYYIFYENKKKKYANQMTEEGINHYNNIFSQLGNPKGQ